MCSSSFPRQSVNRQCFCRHCITWLLIRPPTILSRSNQQIKRSRLPRTKGMQGKIPFLHTGNTAVILPATGTLESPKQVRVIDLTAAIALPVLPNLPCRAHIDLDDACPIQLMAMRTAADTDTCVADHDITAVTPLDPDIEGYG